MLGEFLFSTDSIIFAVSPDGENRRELFPSSGYGYDGDAAWSPDGLFVAFNSYGYEGESDVIFIGHPRDESLRRLTATERLELYARPAWSPDGSRLAFAASEFGDELAPRAIYVIDRDGSNLRVLYEQTRGGFVLGPPTWSPDGTQMIFVDAEARYEDTFPGDEQPTRVMIMDADGANARLLFELESIYWPAYGILDRLAWSPDGTRLAFIADFSSFTGADGGRGLYVANLDGSDQRQIPAKEPFSPVWSPDGNFIAYVAGGYEDPRGIIVTNVAGTSRRVVPDTFGTQQIDWTAGAVETQITGVEVTNRYLTSVIDSDEYPLDNCGSPAQRTDSWRIEHQLTRSFSFVTSLSAGSETTTCHGTNHTATWNIGGELGPIKDILTISGGYSESTEQTSEVCAAVSAELTSAYQLDEQRTVTEGREFSVELPPDSIVNYEITVYEVSVQGYVTVARSNGFYADEVQVPFVLRDRIRIDARPVAATCPEGE
jgi:Tol biopolymer transport system component